jgi:amidase
LPRPGYPADALVPPDAQAKPGEVDRRGFLQTAAFAGIAITVRDRAEAQVPDASGVSPGPRRLLEAEQEFELGEITVAEMQKAMAEGRYTARSVTESYLRRIDAIDRAGPVLRSVLEVNPDALQISDGLDRERKAGNVRGPLHGVPVLLKDVVDTADRMHTTSGSLALMGSFALRDAYIAERLRAAGAVLLGKTNMSEWSNGRSTRATSGWSARGGLTKNPYVLDRTACGSSSGTGVSIAANLATIGVGVETDGSITCPASANCLVGIKPTVGLLSRSGLIPLSTSIDTAGPMARTVTDAAILLGALTGVDSRDIATDASQGNALSDYTASLDPAALKGARIGALGRGLDANSPLTAHFEATLEVLRGAGATIIDDFTLPSIDELQIPKAIVLLCELKDGIRDYLRTRGPEETHRNLRDLIRFNRENADVEMAWFGQEFFETAETTAGRETPDYRPALARCRTLARTMGLDRVLGELQLDAIVGVAANPPFASDLINGDHPIVRNSSLSAVAGYPRVTVPSGFIHDLPVGMSFMGAPWSEPRLIGIAYAFEQASKSRKAPQFLPTSVMDR